MAQERASLEDMLMYTPETYFSDEEMKLIRNTFNGPQGAKILKVIRKIMIPTISDPELPIEEMGKDIYMGSVDFKSIPDDQVKPVALGLQLCAKAVMGGIIQIKQFANVKAESAQERADRLAKDSNQ